MIWALNGNFHIFPCPYAITPLCYAHFFPGWSPHTDQLLYLCTNSHLLLSSWGLYSSYFPSFFSIVKISHSNRSFPLAYTIAINFFHRFSNLLLTPFLAQLHLCTTKLFKWVVSISCLPLTESNQAIGKPFQRNCSHQGYKWPPFSKPQGQFSGLTLFNLSAKSSILSSIYLPEFFPPCYSTNSSFSAMLLFLLFSLIS